MDSILVETIEDLQLRAFRRVRAFGGNARQSRPVKSAVAHSSRYGITIAASPQNQLYSCLSADLHKLGLQSTASVQEDKFGFHRVQHYDPNVELFNIAVNCDGSALALSLNTHNGPFVELYDVVAFAPSTNKQPFPFARMRLHNESATKITDFEWNPAESDVFVVLTSDNTLRTIKWTANGTYSHLGTLILPATCVCWSPKGKQLVVGDLRGRVHQLKPELSTVRVIDGPQNIPIFGMENTAFECAGICWISTTEWLVAHRPANSTSHAPNIGLLCVKKQQPPKWTFYGDVVPAAKAITFSTLLDWHMVFAHSADSPVVAMFGLRGDHWVKFEFETFDIEMPLTDAKNDTYPIGAALDFSSTTPIQLEQGERIFLSPQPIVHFVNSSGLLLSYAILSLDNERATLTKAPEPILVEKANFGQPPPGYVPPQTERAVQPVHATPTVPGQTDQQSGAAFVPSQVQQENRPVGASDDVPVAISTPQMEKPRQQLEREREERKAAERLAEERRRVTELEQALGRSVAEYTAVRNVQTQLVDRLQALRREVEKSATSLQMENLDELADVRRDLQQSLHNTMTGLDKYGVDLQRHLEAAHTLRMFRQEAKTGEIRHEAPRGKLSFDTEKRLEQANARYEHVLGKMECTRRALDGLLSESGKYGHAGDEVIDPVEQRNLIQTNENISKMCAKLGSRLRQMGRSKVTVLGKKGGAMAASNKVGTSVADFCAMELNQLALANNAGGKRTVVDPAQIDEEEGRKVAQNRHNCLANICRQGATIIRRIQPLRATPTQREHALTADEADRRLVQKLRHAVNSPLKPELVSIGVQSPPEFAGRAKEKTPKKPVPNKTDSAKGGTLMPQKSSEEQILRQNVTAAPLDATRPGFLTPPSTGVASVSTAVPVAPPASSKIQQTPTKAPTLAAATTARMTPTSLPGVKVEQRTSPATVATTQPTATPQSEEAHQETAARDKDVRNKMNAVEEAAKNAEEGMAATEEGMEDEVSTGAGQTPVTFDFLKSGLGGLGSSTPINANKNPFGSMIASPQQQQNASATSSSMFSTPPSSFGANPFSTPKPAAGFGSFGASSAFGASPFASPAPSSTAFGTSSFGSGGALSAAQQQQSAFGAGATFGATSPFAPAASGFGSATPFGGGATGSGKSLFGGGGMASGGSTGFSAFAGKSSGFGQLASQSQQQAGGASLFGGGPTASGSTFSGLGSTAQNQGTSLSNQNKSAFTMFRK